MKRNEIDKVFTQKVAEYIANGYIINSSTMSGHQGEEGKVDLVKGEELIRVWMSRETEGWSRENDSYHGYKLVIRVGRWNESAAHISTWTTAWMRDFEILEEITYYEVSNWYVDSREEAMETQNKRYDRYKNKTLKYRDHEEFNITSENSVNIAREYLKRRAGYKRVTSSDIKVVKQVANDFCHAHYFVVYHGETYKMS